MKTFYLLLLFFPILSFCQTEPPKKSTKIIVATIDSTNTQLGKITVALFDRGFTVENKDEQLKILSTNERPSKKHGTTSKIRVAIKDSIIVFASVISLDFEWSLLSTKQTKSFSDVYYGGSKNSPLREAWNELYEIAKQFGPVTYSK